MHHICVVPDKHENDLGCDPDASQDALNQVEELTGSDPIKGEDLLESEVLKRQFREAKQRLSGEAN